MAMNVDLQAAAFTVAHRFGRGGSTRPGRRFHRGLTREQRTTMDVGGISATGRAGEHHVGISFMKVVLACYRLRSVYVPSLICRCFLQTAPFIAR
jgi:hypothetical protein